MGFKLVYSLKSWSRLFQTSLPHHWNQHYRLRRQRQICLLHKKFLILHRQTHGHGPNLHQMKNKLSTQENAERRRGSVRCWKGTWARRQRCWEVSVGWRKKNRLPFKTSWRQERVLPLLVKTWHQQRSARKFEGNAAMALMLIQMLSSCRWISRADFRTDLIHSRACLGFRLDPEHAAESQGKASVSVYGLVCNSS